MEENSIEMWNESTGHLINASNSSQSNTSSDCYDLEATEVWTTALHAVVLSVIIVASFAANGLVLLLVTKYKRLRTRSVGVSLSVVAADVLLTLTYSVPALASTIVRRWPFASAGCSAFGFLGLIFLITRWFIMGVLSIDRFCTVRFPFSYERYSKRVLIALTLVAWLVPLILSTSSLDGFAEISFRENVPTCWFNCMDDGRCKLFYNLYFSVAYIFGGVLPTVLYVWLYWRARKLRRSTVKLGVLLVKAASGAIVSQPIAQPDNNSRESKALFTFVLIFVSVLATGLPAYIFYFVRLVNQQAHCRIPIILHFIAVEIFTTSTVLDPLVIMRDRDFRLCLKDLLCNCCSPRTVGDSAASLQSQCNGITNSTTSVALSASRRHSQCTLLSTIAVPAPTDTANTSGSINTSTDSIHEQAVSSV